MRVLCPSHGGEPERCWSLHNPTGHRKICTVCGHDPNKDRGHFKTEDGYCHEVDEKTKLECKCVKPNIIDNPKTIYDEMKETNA